MSQSITILSQTHRSVLLKRISREVINLHWRCARIQNTIYYFDIICMISRRNQSDIGIDIFAYLPFLKRRKVLHYIHIILQNRHTLILSLQNIAVHFRILTSPRHVNVKFTNRQSVKGGNACLAKTAGIRMSLLWKTTKL